MGGFLLPKIPKVDLSINCCGIKYSPKDPETYIYFYAWKNDYSSSAEKETIKNQKVYSTITYELACRQHGCTKVKILKFAKSGAFIECEEINKATKAIKYLNTISMTAKEIALRSPDKRMPHAKRIQPFYGYGCLRENKMQQISLDGLIRGQIYRTPFTSKIDISLIIPQEYEKDVVKTA